MTTQEQLLNAIQEHSGMDHEQIRDAGIHGADAGWPGFTYTADAVEFYCENKEAIWELLNEEADSLGMTVLEMIASFNRKDMADTPAGFENLLAWFALEEVGRGLEANHEYEQA